MSFTHTVAVGYNTDSGAMPNPSLSYTGGEASGLDVAVAPLTVDGQYYLPITVSDVVCCYLYSDRAVTIKTYLGGSLQQTIALPAAKPQVWRSDSIETCPFTANFDHWRISNADAVNTANLKARFLMVGVGS
jgi:hypothetical protein